MDRRRNALFASTALTFAQSSKKYSCKKREYPVPERLRQMLHVAHMEQVGVADLMLAIEQNADPLVDRGEHSGAVDPIDVPRYPFVPGIRHHFQKREAAAQRGVE